jgi:hypothetical protein
MSKAIKKRNREGAGICRAGSWRAMWAASALMLAAVPLQADNMVWVTDPVDMADASGDIRGIQSYVLGNDLHLAMWVEHVAGPAMEQTPDGMNNRYYYHWLLDTDNNPATGRSNAEYEESPTGVAQPIGAELVVQVGWRDGKPNGIDVYNAVTEETLFSGFPYQLGGSRLAAILPLADLGLEAGQTIAISAFQEGSSDDWAVDWMEPGILTLDAMSSGRMKIDGDFADWAEAAAEDLVVGVDDPEDMADSSGDIKRIEATVENGALFLRMAVHGIVLPSVEETPPGMNNRYYYHWLIDTDNNPATGRSNAEYEESPTGVTTPIGAERVVMIGWRDGAPNGVEVYDAVTEETLLVDFDYGASGDSMEAMVPFAPLGVVAGQTVAISAFQEGSSDDWATDWMESTQLTLTDPGSGGLSLETEFSGNPYGFAITVHDGEGGEMVDAGTVGVQVNGVDAESVMVEHVADPGYTMITGRNPELLVADEVHKWTLSCEIDGLAQTESFTFKVVPYSVLPLEGRFASIDTSNEGFVVSVTQISAIQTSAGAVHENIAEIAEEQFAGELENFGVPFYNEADLECGVWCVNPVVHTGVVNWYELAPGESYPTGFPDDEAFPKLGELLSGGIPLEGDVIELLTYLELEQGYNQLGLFTEGGHKISNGFGPDGLVLSLFDNAEWKDAGGEGDAPVPSYYPRSQVMDVVAPEAGYYPFRFLWFQSNSREAPGILLELFSVKDKQLHLLNDDGNPEAIMAYRAGVLIDPDFVAPTLSASSDGVNLSITWTGTLQTAVDVNGPWTDYGDDSQSPADFSLSENPSLFFRSRSN